MNIKNIVRSIKEKLLKPKVYALVLKKGNLMVLTIEAAYSLDDAYLQAKKKLHAQDSSWGNADVRIEMFHHASLPELLEEVTDQEIVGDKPKEPVPEVKPEKKLFVPSNSSVVAETVPEDKNVLMRRIVEKKDLVLLEEKKSTFSTPEYQYLLGEIMKGTKNKGKKDETKN